MKDIRDTYLDTRQRPILAVGYSYRLREAPEGIVTPLKSLDRMYKRRAGCNKGIKSAIKYAPEAKESLIEA